MTLMCDSVEILLGEIRCLSLLGVKGLRIWHTFKDHLFYMKLNISVLAPVSKKKLCEISKVM